LKYLFYEKETDTKAKVMLIYNVEPPKEILNKDNYIVVDDMPENKYGNFALPYCNPKTNEFWWEVDIDKFKNDKIAQSKTLLAEFLQNTKLPSKAHNNTLGYYSVTEEKQSLLMGNFFAYQLEKQVNPEAKLTWNESGKACEEWTEEEVTQLMLEIKNFVKPIVSYQQHLEEQINACETIEEVEAIEINYEQFKTW
jgi:hypothetical protein